MEIRAWWHWMCFSWICPCKKALAICFVIIQGWANLLSQDMLKREATMWLADNVIGVVCISSYCYLFDNQCSNIGDLVVQENNLWTSMTAGLSRMIYCCSKCYNDHAAQTCIAATVTEPWTAKVYNFFKWDREGWNRRVRHEWFCVNVLERWTISIVDMTSQLVNYAPSLFMEMQVQRVPTKVIRTSATGPWGLRQNIWSHLYPVNERSIFNKHFAWNLI